MKEQCRFFNRQVEDVSNAFTVVRDFQGFFVVALATTDLAGNVDIRQKAHLHLDLALPRAYLTTSTFDVKGETTRLVAAQTRFRQQRKELAHLIPKTDIGSRY